MTTRPLLISPSILSADFARLGEEVAALDKAGADWMHIDVMDGQFVPNITFGAPVMKAVKSYSAKPFDVHLMIEAPDQYLAQFAASGADILTVHAEACKHLDRSLQAIRNLGIKAGVSLNPATPISAIAHVIDRLDLILVMTVNPGFGGQSFISAMLDKIAQAKVLVGGRAIDIEVDGGITTATAPLAYRAGANVLVAGSAVFKTPDYAGNIRDIRTAAATIAA